MSLFHLATLALATGFAAASPITAPVSKRNDIFGGRQFGDQAANGAVLNGFSGEGFNFADGFQNFNKQQQLIDIKEQDLKLQDDNFKEQALKQVNELLVVDQVNNGFNNDLNNLFRKSSFENKDQDVTTIIIVVQEISIFIDDGRGNVFAQEIFAQSIQVANRGEDETKTVMIFDSRTLIAQDILGDDAFNKIQGFGGVAGATAAFDGAMPTKTNGVQLLGAKPTWTDVAEDPAATLGAIWQKNVEDLQANGNDEADNKLNEELLKEVLKALEELKDDVEELKDDVEAKKDDKDDKDDKEHKDHKDDEDRKD